MPFIRRQAFRRRPTNVSENYRAESGEGSSRMLTLRDKGGGPLDSLRRRPGFPPQVVSLVLGSAELMRLNGYLYGTRKATRKTMQEVSGNWDLALLFRRPAFCLLERPFTWTSTAPEQRKVPLPLGVTDELLHLFVFAPLLFSELGAPLSSTILATDASGGKDAGLGACARPRLIEPGSPRSTGKTRERGRILVFRRHSTFRALIISLLLTLGTEP